MQAQAGCTSTSCSASGLVYPVITVTDAQGRPICDANVIVVAGDASSMPLEATPASDGGGGCTYRWETFGYAGTFVLQVSKAGYQSVTLTDVEVRGAPCNGDLPSAQQVDVTLK